ncbi:hemerythrin domain-containing protein [Daejeonella oryzae]|uniref:hemerythrin domain-containing protein n=1 Tax=Daejeonella oryzae TaxID=1122943 RepID=UPI000411E439|nr:hemerythrin domain-containing protein [Daejeonella oryzae]
MKRHPALIPLSREHHGALILARLIQKDAPAYKGLPEDHESKSIYALNFYEKELIKHFEEEEKVFKLVTGTTKDLDLLIETILQEHQELHGLFRSIPNHPDLKSHLHQLGKFLEAHIRKEERQVFPQMQETCSDEQWATIEKIVSLTH